MEVSDLGPVCRVPRYKKVRGTVLNQLRAVSCRQKRQAKSAGAANFAERAAHIHTFVSSKKRVWNERKREIIGERIERWVNCTGRRAGFGQIARKTPHLDKAANVKVGTVASHRQTA